jgi:hypothetical protein
MSQDIKGDHFKLVKDIHQDMEDFIIEIFWDWGRPLNYNFLVIDSRFFGLFCPEKT